MCSISSEKTEGQKFPPVTKETRGKQDCTEEMPGAQGREDLQMSLCPTPRGQRDCSQKRSGLVSTVAYLHAILFFIYAILHNKMFLARCSGARL